MAAELGLLVLLAYSLGTARTYNATVFVVVALLGWAMYLLAFLVIKLWRTRTALTTTPEALLVADRILRRRRKVPWQTITAVTRWDDPWWRRIGRLALNEIVTDGDPIIFGTHLFWYSEFVAELRRRAVNCRQFDPHPLGVGERPQV